jgi:PAS domain S-box-containing protein
VDRDGRILRWNRAAERILGCPARDVVGRRCREVFQGRDPAGNPVCLPGCQVRTLLGRGSVVEHFEMSARTRGGRRVWLDVSVLGTAGLWRDAAAIHLFRDVTASREIETLVRERLAPRPEPSGAGGPSAELTRRELDVLRLLAGGAGTGAMAARLHVSPATVRNHVQNILGKLGLHSRLEAAAYAVRHRLL